MPRLLSSLCLALILAAAPALADDPIRPDPRLTPGAVLTTDLAVICQPGYSNTIRRASERLKAEVYREYGLDPRKGHYEIDHLIPLSLGGSDAQANLWPESWDTQPWNAVRKGLLEVYLRAQTCAGRVPIDQAQREIAADWVSAYKRYLGEPPSVQAQR